MKIDSVKAPMISDEETVSLILKGEKHLYEDLIRKFNLRLYRIGMSIIDDDQEVEDIMQTAYLNAYLQLSSFKNNSSFGTWLTRIFINQSLLHKTKRTKRQQMAAAQINREYHTNTPLKDLMNKELKGILEKAVGNLPEKYRMVFVMREVQEMSTLETADVLNLGESNVKIRLTRAKEMLRDELSSYYKSSQLYEFNLVRCDRIADFVMRRILDKGN